MKYRIVFYLMLWTVALRYYNKWEFTVISGNLQLQVKEQPPSSVILAHGAFRFLHVPRVKKYGISRVTSLQQHCTCRRRRIGRQAWRWHWKNFIKKQQGDRSRLTGGRFFNDCDFFYEQSLLKTTGPNVRPSQKLTTMKQA